jgi:hypothetical protein
MRKFLLAIFLLLSSLLFAQQVNIQNYWNKELARTQDLVQVIDKTYQVEIQATNTELIFSITNELKTPFTKYDNITLSTLIYKSLLQYSSKLDKFKNITTINIITQPYRRVIEVNMLEKIITENNNKYVLGDFINASQIYSKQRK